MDDTTGNALDINSRDRSLLPKVVLLVAIVAVATLPGFSQSNLDLRNFFLKDIGLSQDQVTAIENGQPVAKTMPSRVPAEVFLVGAVYIHATPESYVKFAHDFERFRKVPSYLALGVFSNPPQSSDLKGFSFESDDIEALKDCKPGD